MVDDEQDIGLDELRLNGGRAHRQDRLTREDRRALRHGVNIAREVKIMQVGQKFLAEELPAAQIGDVAVGEMQILDVFDHLLQTGCDGKAAAVRNVSVKHVEIADAVAHLAGEEPVSHRQLIEVAEHGHVQFFVLEWHFQFPPSGL